MRYDFPIPAGVLGGANHTLALQMAAIPRGSDVLELGAATGRVTQLLRESLDCRVTAVELDATAAALIRPHCERLIVADLDSEADLGAIGGAYDVILAGDVLEHLRRPEAALRILRGRLKPGGRWVISVPNVAHWSIRRRLLFGHFDYTRTGLMDRTHVSWFTRKSLASMLVEAGYAVAAMDAVATLPLQDRLRLRGVAAWLGRKHVLDGLLAYQWVAQAVVDPHGRIAAQA